ncbi:MAG: hypothetical protein EPO00_03630 [Chloroflexota bacterium]|nr:MAG: hypothetical protein EPO00_03630 [Chloroflexota bacterium]
MSGLLRRLAIRSGFTAGYHVEAPPGWRKVGQFGSMLEFQSPDDASHIRVVAFRDGAWATLAEFDRVTEEGRDIKRFTDATELLVTGRSETRLWGTTPAIRTTFRTIQSTVPYEWESVIAIVGRRPVEWLLRVRLSVTPEVQTAFESLIASFLPDP